MPRHFEHRTEPLLSRKHFAIRVTRFGLAGMLVLSVALGIGILGYHFIVDLKWIDALLEASMILGGMGPIANYNDKDTATKLFASFYALFSGVVFLSASAIFVAPALHRILHRLHVEKSSRGSKEN